MIAEILGIYGAFSVLGAIGLIICRGEQLLGIDPIRLNTLIVALLFLPGILFVYFVFAIAAILSWCWEELDVPVGGWGPR